MRVLFFALNVVFGIVVPLGIQLLDRRYMTPKEREWVWGFATWGSALYNFGPLSLVAWGYVTRSPRYLRGLAIGVALTAGALVIQGVLSGLFGWALGLPRRELSESWMAVGAMIAASAALGVLVGAGRAIHEVVRGADRGPW